MPGAFGGPPQSAPGVFLPIFDFWKIAHKVVTSMGKTLVLPFFSYSAKIYAKREKKVP